MIEIHSVTINKGFIYSEFNDSVGFKRLRFIIEHRINTRPTFVEYGKSNGLLSLMLLKNSIVKDAVVILSNQLLSDELQSIALKNNVELKIEHDLDRVIGKISLSAFLDTDNLEEFLRLDFNSVGKIFAHIIYELHLALPFFLLELSNSLRDFGFELMLDECQYTTYIFVKTT